MPQVLIVEVGDSVLNTLEPSLTQEGFAIRQVREHEGVLPQVLKSPPELILIRLDDENGFETCKQIKGNPETENIPVIFMAEKSSSNGELIRTLESGANDYIVMDRDMGEIMIRLQFALRYRRALSHSEALAKQLNEINDEIYERNLQVEKDLNVARQLQQSLLPPELPNTAINDPGLEFQFSKCHFINDTIRITGLYVPCDALGGDLYDVMHFSDDTIGITVADVSGHGVPAGFITAIFKASFYRTTHMFTSPGDILFNLNNELANIIKTGEYITAIFCRILNGGRTVQYSGAGHPYPILYRAASGELERLTENGPPLVWFKDMDYPVGEVPLEPGDKLLIFTDGISEMKNPGRDILGEEALEQLFLKHAKAGSPAPLDAMVMELSDYTEGHPLEDDMSAVLIEAL